MSLCTNILSLSSLYIQCSVLISSGIKMKCSRGGASRASTFPQDSRRDKTKRLHGKDMMWKYKALACSTPRGKIVNYNISTAEAARGLFTTVGVWDQLVFFYPDVYIRNKLAVSMKSSCTSKHKGTTLSGHTQAQRKLLQWPWLYIVFCRYEALHLRFLLVSTEQLLRTW